MAEPIESLRANSIKRIGNTAIAGFDTVDFDAFHREELPRRLKEGLNEKIAWDVAGLRPLSIGLPDGRAYSYVAAGERVEIVSGIADDAETVLEIDESAWQDYVNEFRTRFSLLYSGVVKFVRGRFDTWERWEPAIRCMYSGRSIFDPKNPGLVDRDRNPLDLHRSFTLDDDPAEMTHFLRTTGYLVVRNVFDSALIETLSREVDRLRDEAVEGDVGSWWASTASGERFPYRLTYAGLRSDAILSLDDHPKLRQLVALAEADVIPTPDRMDGHIVVLKEFSHEEEVDAYANLPFHRDCGFGGCPVMCPQVNVGVQLDAQNAESSQLEFIAGTIFTMCHDRRSDDESDLPLVKLETQPGDATVHFGCATHRGPAPGGPGQRRTLYVSHYSPKITDLIPERHAYNELIPGYANGEVQNETEHQETFGDDNRTETK